MVMLSPIWAATNTAAPQRMARRAFALRTCGIPTSPLRLTRSIRAARQTYQNSSTGQGRPGRGELRQHALQLLLDLPHHWVFPAAFPLRADLDRRRDLEG